MVKLNYYLEDNVEALLNKKGLNFEEFSIDIKNPEIPVDEIAEKIGCKIEYKFLISKAGYHNQKTKVIVVNALDPVYRQRFTIAHEIGHQVYNHEGIRNRITQDQISDITRDDKSYLDILIERQANDFASKLLMPKKLVLEVENYLKTENEIRNDKQTIVKLAEKFNVSYIAMEYRLRVLKKNE